MRIAIAEAWKGCGFTNPNPMVGCVIVKNGVIIGKGFHKKYGDLHAERNALASCTESPEGATVYVTLEPCCHWGRTPPCTDALIESKVVRVVSGSRDPNPLVSGKSGEILKKAGIKTETGILKEECDALNEAFFHYITCGTPFVILKYAMTADGKTATVSGKSKWITGEKARSRVHFDRHRYGAVMAGVGTVLTDDPMLTCRFENPCDGSYPETEKISQPLRIICDTGLNTPLSSKIVKTAGDFPTLIATGISDPEKTKPFTDAGCRVLSLPEKDDKIDMQVLMKKLGEMKIDSVIIEGGPTLAWSALAAGIVNKTNIYLAPKIFGGTGKSGVAGTGVFSPDEAFMLSEPKVTDFEGDLLLESRVIYPEKRKQE